MASRDKALSILKDAIRIILEESDGSLEVRGFKGYGASHPYYKHSSRRSLGIEEEPDRDEEEIEVVISRAFKK